MAPSRLVDLARSQPRIVEGDPLAGYARPTPPGAGPMVVGAPVDDWFAQQQAGGAPGGGGLAATDPRVTGNWQQWFYGLFPGESLSHADLVAKQAELAQYGVKLRPNASGRVGKIELPDGRVIDVVQGGEAGVNRRQWLDGPGQGGAGGIGTGLETSPGYQFRLGEGLKALERSAASRGTLLTGGTLKGLQRYAQDYASGEYGARVNQLSNLAQLGYGAASGQAGLGSTYANQAGGLLGQQATNIGDLITQGGNAAAAGTIGGANAWQQGLGGMANMAQLYYLSRLMNQPAAGTPPVR